MPAKIIIAQRLPMHRVSHGLPNDVRYAQGHDRARAMLEGADLVVIEGEYYYVTPLAMDVKRHDNRTVTLQYSSGLVRTPADYLDGCVPKDGRGGDSILEELMTKPGLQEMLRRLDPEELRMQFPKIAWYAPNFRRKWL